MPFVVCNRQTKLILSWVARGTLTFDPVTEVGFPIGREPDLINEIWDDATDVRLRTAAEQKTFDDAAIKTAGSSIIRRLFSDFEPKVKARDILEETIYSFTIPAGTLVVNDMIRLFAYGRAFTSASVKTIRLKHQNNIIVVNDVTGSPSTLRWAIRGEGSRTANGGGELIGEMTVGSNLQTTNGVQMIAAAWDSAQIFSITGQLAVAATNQILFQGFAIDLVGSSR